MTDPQAPGGEPRTDPPSASGGPVDERSTETIRVPWEAAAPPVAPAPAPRVGWTTPPPRVTAEVPGAPGLAFADTMPRFVAYAIDGFIVYLVWALLVGIAISATDPRQSGSSAEGIVYVVLFLVLSLGYSVFFWSGGRRASPGQLAFRIQVGNAFDGRPLTVAQAFLRWVGLGWLLWGLVLLPPVASVAPFAALIWPLVLLVTAVRSPFKQGLHDRFANSAVVRPRDASSRGAVLACGLIVVLVVVVFAIGILALYLLGSQASDILEDIGRSV